MSIDETRLAEMLCTRLCHDLTGPIGAVNNGAEFLSEDGFDMQHEAMQLIFSSATEAVNRLQFYRQAYGRVGESGEASLSDKKALAALFFSGSKITLDWPDSHTDASGISISQKTARLILNLLIIASGSLIRGGTIRVRLSSSAPDTKEISVIAEGETVKIDPDTQAILLGKTDAGLTPKSAQAYLSACLMRDVGCKLALEASPNQLQLHVTQRQILSAAAGQ